MKLSFPPLQVRVEALPHREHNRTTFVKRVNILSWVNSFTFLKTEWWVTVSNLTKELHKLEENEALQRHLLAVSQSRLKGEIARLQEEINRIGVHLPSAFVRTEGGSYLAVDPREFVRIELDKSGAAVFSKEKATRIVSFTPVINTSRPNKGNGGDGGGKKDKQNNNNNNQQ